MHMSTIAPHGRRPANGVVVADLSARLPDPSLLRIQRIRTWLAQRSMDADLAPVAAVALFVTADAGVQSTALGVEPEHRAYIAAELRRLADMLCPEAAFAVA